MVLDELIGSINRRDWQDLSAEAGTVRFAVVGLGWFSREYALPAMEDAVFCEPTVVVDANPEAVEKATNDAEYRGLSPDEFHEGRGKDQYDAVYIVIPNGFHLDYAESAASFGKHVLCEKPMEKNVERSRSMVRVCESNEVQLMVAYRMQLEPTLRRARELIHEGCFGEPVCVHSTITQQLFDLLPDRDQWRLDPEVAGGGALMNIGLYPLNTSRFLLDDDPVQGHATTSSSRPEFDRVEETVSFQLDFPDDTVVYGLASEGGHEGSHLTFVGTEGRFHVEPAYQPWLARNLTLQLGDSEATVSPDPVNQLTEEFDYFSHCLLTERTPGPDGRSGLADQIIMEGLYESADAGKRVEFSLVN